MGFKLVIYANDSRGILPGSLYLSGAMYVYPGAENVHAEMRGSIARWGNPVSHTTPLQDRGAGVDGLTNLGFFCFQMGLTSDERLDNIKTSWHEQLLT